MACNIGFCPAKVPSITVQCILNNTIAAVNRRHYIVFVNYSRLIDTKNVLVPFRVHARDGFSDLFIPGVGNLRLFHPYLLAPLACQPVIMLQLCGVHIRDGTDRNFVSSVRTTAKVYVRCPHRDRICYTFPCPQSNCTAACQKFPFCAPEMNHILMHQA